MTLRELFQFAIRKNASDIHLSDGITPRIRVDGELITLQENILENKNLLHHLTEIMTTDQIEYFQQHKDLDFAITLPDIGRFRINLFQQHNGVAVALRIIPDKIPAINELELPPIIQSLTQISHGLILITGPTGSGKSTTLAAILDEINTNQFKHIMTIEDPIEFRHHSKKSLIHQRELYRDTNSFYAALRACLREDPDIIMIGELRDLKTIRLALTAAETGHLVFATVHTSSAAKTINRIIDVFPGDEKQLVRALLAESLQAVISQRLMKKISTGRVAVFEILLCNPAIRNLIREEKIQQIYSYMQTNTIAGMQTLEQHMQTLLVKGVIAV